MSTACAAVVPPAAAGGALALERSGRRPQVPEALPPGALCISQHTAMGGPLELSLPPSDVAACAAILETVSRTEQGLSAFRPDSELHLLNQRAALDWTPTSPLLSAVLAASASVHALTAGAFDPTVGPLLQAWGFRSRPANSAPWELLHARSRVGLSRVRRDAGRVAFDKDGMSLDFGGIAVGFALDQAVEAARAVGASSGLINAAGDIRAIGPRPDGEPWTIGLRDPAQADRIFATVCLHGNRALTTSGTYEKFVATKEGRVSHIFDPRTGESPREVISATVIASDAMLADALATASIVLGAREALSMLEGTPDVEGLLVVEGGRGRRLMGTDGFDAQIFHEV